MNTKTKLIPTLLSMSIVVGCASGGSNNQAIGAGAGALSGALAGGLIGGDWKGALIGAAAGAAIGWGTAALIDYNSTQVRSEASDREIYGVSERVSSPLVKIRKGSALPARVRAGDQVRVVTDYSLQLPQNTPDASVQESWVLKKDGEKLAELPAKTSKRTGGGWQADANISIPKEAKPGTYVIEHKVQTGTSYDTDESTFVIGA